MKKVAIFLFAMIIFTIANAQEGRKLPNANVKDLRGTTVATSQFENDGKPIVVNFWATWCKPCMEELAAIHELYSEWQEETGVKFIAVSLDDSRSSRRVAPFVRSKGWDFEVYLDENHDFKRAMNVNNPPHTFILNGKGEIVWEHNGYAPGDEKKLFEEIKKVAKEK